MIKKITTEREIISQICALESKYFSAPLSENELLQMGQSETYEILALQYSGDVLAYIAATVGLYECQIIKVAVAEQKHGYGKLILKAFIEKHKGKKICLEVRQSNNAAQALYLSANFIIDGVRRDLYENPVEDGLVMHFFCD